LRLRSSTNIDIIKEISLDRDHISAITFSPDGCTIGIGTWEGITLFKYQQGRIFQRMRKVWRKESNGGEIFALTFSPSGDMLLAGHRLGWKIYDVNDGAVLEECLTQQINMLAFGPSGDEFITGGDSGALVWVKGNKDWLVADACGGLTGDGTLTPDSASHAVCVCPGTGTFTATGYYNGIVEVFNYKSSDKPFILGSHDKAVLSMAFNPDGSLLLTVGADGIIGVWEMDWNWDFSKA